MSDCDCYKIGGPFIAEDPSCPIHGAGGMQDELATLKEQNALLAAQGQEARKALEAIKEAVCGERKDRWDTNERVTIIRGAIADACDKALILSHQDHAMCREAEIGRGL